MCANLHTRASNPLNSIEIPSIPSIGAMQAAVKHHSLLSRVHIITGDSDVVPKDNGSYSSRVTFMVGNAAIEAAQNLKHLLVAAAARKLEAQPDDLECLGEVYRAGAQDKGLMFDELVTEALKDAGTITVTGNYSTVPVGDSSPPACAALIESIEHSLATGEADVATLQYVYMRSALYAALVARSKPPAALRHVPMIHMARAIGSEESFSATLSRGERSQFKRPTRALSDRFKEKVRLERFCDPSRLERLIEDAEIVARNSYQRQLGVGFRDITESWQQLRLAAEKGWHILYLDDQPCSFWIASVYGGTLHSDYLAYDPSFRQYSVGMVLIMTVIDTIYRERTLVQVNEIDFGVGDAEYKRRLSNRSWEEASLSLFSPRAMGFTLRSLDFIVTTANSAAIAVLNRSGLLSRVKRWWRRKLTRCGQEQ